MAISLSKGGNVNLSKEAPGLTTVKLGLGWDVRATDGAEFDLDGSAFMLKADGKVQSDNGFIFYNNKTSSCGSVNHAGDNRTGAGDGDDEQIIVLLDSIPADIAKIVFVASIYEGRKKNQHFGRVQNAFIRAVDARGREMVRTDLSASPETQNKCSMVFAELNRNGLGWEFKSLLRPEATDRFVDILRDYYAAPRA